MKHSQVYNKGFTLIELLVAVFVFSILIAVSLGTIFAVINANKKAQSLKSAISNLNFAMEVMTRDIRFGNSYQPIPTGNEKTLQICPGTEIAPHNGAVKGEKINYFFDSNSGAIWRKFGNNVTTDIIGATRLTGEETTITGLTFTPTNEIGSEQKVRINIKGFAQVGKDSKTDFNLQTTVATRCVNCTCP